MAASSRSASMLIACFKVARVDSQRPSVASCSRWVSSASSSHLGSKDHVPIRTSQSNPDDVFDIKSLETFQFDDSPTVGHNMLEAARNKLALLNRMESDHAVLQKQRKEFVPPSPSQFIRLKSVINLDKADDPQTRKRVASFPVRSLPLNSPEARHRFKLLAGPRWTPPRGADVDGNSELDADGTFKISSEQFPVGEMNRKWIMDTLGKLIDEANVREDSALTVASFLSSFLRLTAESAFQQSSTSTLAALPTLPLDTRHVLSHQRKKKSGRTGGQRVFSRAEVLRKSKGGAGVPGFPAEWL